MNGFRRSIRFLQWIVLPVCMLFSGAGEMAAQRTILSSVDQSRPSPAAEPAFSCSIETNVTNPPADITISWDSTRARYEGMDDGIIVTALIRNVGTATANRSRATLLLPEQVVLEEGETAIKLTDPVDLPSQMSASVSWRVRLMPQTCQRTETTFEVIVTAENAEPAHCALRVIIDERPCIMRLDVPDDIIGVTGQIITVPVLFHSISSDPIHRYRLMLKFDPTLLRFLDVVSVGTRTGNGWSGPHAELLASDGASSPDVLLLEDVATTSSAWIAFRETGVLVSLRFEVAFDPVFRSTGDNGHVTQAAFEFEQDRMTSSGRHIVLAFNSAIEDQYSSISTMLTRGTVTVTSPCAWPLQSTASLTGNHPNPFNPSTTVRYELLRDTEVRIVVLDMFGRELRVLEEGVRMAGQHSVVFDAKDLPGGMYLYQMRTPSGVNTRRMLLLR